MKYGMNSSIKTSVLLQVTRGIDTATVCISLSWADIIILAGVHSRERVLGMALAQSGDGRHTLIHSFHIALEMSMPRRFVLVMLTC